MHCGQQQHSRIKLQHYRHSARNVPQKLSELCSGILRSVRNACSKNLLVDNAIWVAMLRILLTTIRAYTLTIATSLHSGGHSSACMILYALFNAEFLMRQHAQHQQHLRDMWVPCEHTNSCRCNICVNVCCRPAATAGRLPRLDRQGGQG